MKLLIFSCCWLLMAPPSWSNQDPDDQHMPRKVVHFSRADIMQELPVMQIQCQLTDDLWPALVPSHAPVKTKPNRYIFTTWQMHLNDLWCHFTPQPSAGAGL